MARARTDLHEALLEICENVYYQAPASKDMEYPAIRYHKKTVEPKYANNKIYSTMNCYEVFVISRKVDDPINDKILELPYCKHDRNYRSDNLEHDVYTLYY